MKLELRSAAAAAAPPPFVYSYHCSRCGAPLPNATAAAHTCALSDIQWGTNATAADRTAYGRLQITGFQP